MLFKEKHLKGIKSGNITMAFRRWQKAAVKAGSLLNTSIGQIEIRKVETVNENDITDTDAINAGFTDKEELIKTFAQNIKGTIFKISVRYHSADPRIKLREQTRISEPQYTDLKNNLERLDNLSKHGRWTKKILLAINDNPGLHASGIAKRTGFEKDWLKLNIRKLKNLGLTISRTIGYEISPLGKFFIGKLKAGD